MKELLLDRYNKALTESDLDEITEIVSSLNSLPARSKKEVLSFYQKIEEDLFERDKSVNNLDSPKFIQSINDWEERQAKEGIKEKTVDEVAPVSIENGGSDFDNQFVNFYNRNRRIFSELKDFYFLRLDSDETVGQYSVLLLCDDGSIHLPIISEIYKQENERGSAIDKLTVSKFVETYKNPLNVRGNFICILSITPNLLGLDGVKSDLESLFKLFEVTTLLIVKTRSIDITIADFEGEMRNEKIEAVLSENANKIFNNKILSYDRERIIKSFFERNTVVINYRILNPGASGSSVIEVQATSVLVKSSKRYVIKVAEKKEGQELKLQAENKNFISYVRDASTTKTIYHAEYRENEVLEAIQYNYASPGSINDAKSFAEILNNYLRHDVAAGFSVVSVIEALLKCELIEHWNSPVYAKKTGFDFYAPFLKKEQLITEIVHQINADEVDSSILLTNYEFLKNLMLESNEKICHGDLHSDNFFWDGEYVTLIDFGFTGVHHAVVDHTSLEVSIRMKHFPRFVPPNEIMKYEQLMFDIRTFDPDFDLSFIKREKLREFYKAIIAIRVDAKKYMLRSDSIAEYMTSLFFMCFRQIQYQDLNQLFALYLSDLLAKELIKSVEK